jgi:predicted deacylase
MLPSIQIGTAHNQPGQFSYGTFDAVPLPTGGYDTFPVVIAQGHNHEGPVLWLTANIHGGEYDGLAVIHQLLTPDLLAELTGTIIAIPTLSPAGLRTGQRSPYYLHGRDPNRLFPAWTNSTNASDSTYPTALETAYARLFDHIAMTADYLIDLHNFGIRSIPFVFRDPVFYQGPRDRPGAEKLQNTVGEMVKALGLTVVNEYSSADYLRLKLHRSVSGATLNTARTPAVTIEIGGHNTLNVSHVMAVTAAIRNMMRWAGMLPGAAEPLRDITVVKPSYPVRRTTHPRVPTACIVHHLVQPGDWVQTGEAVARMADVYGRPTGTADGLLRSNHAGLVIGLFPGVAFYPNDPILGLAIRDTNDTIVPTFEP